MAEEARRMAIYDFTVVPAKAGIQRRLWKSHWIPAYAGTT